MSSIQRLRYLIKSEKFEYIIIKAITSNVEDVSSKSSSREVVMIEILHMTSTNISTLSSHPVPASWANIRLSSLFGSWHTWIWCRYIEILCTYNRFISYIRVYHWVFGRKNKVNSMCSLNRGYICNCLCRLNNGYTLWFFGLLKRAIYLVIVYVA